MNFRIDPTKKDKAPVLTLEAKMLSANRHPSGFDYLRPMLALGVIADHTFGICYGDVYFSYTRHISEPVYWMIVPAFFALSGFLVAGSLERCQTLVSFLSLRALRIFPALCVEVLISALLIGSIYTKLPLSAYFSDHLFLKYFLNILGEPQYRLPGVFDDHPTKIINGQIWTIPFELICYISISFIAVFQLYKRKYALLAMVALAYISQIINIAVRPPITYNGPTGTTTVVSFIVGVALFRFRGQVPHSGKIACICALACVWLAYTPLGIRFVAAPIAYVIVYAGLLNPRKMNFLNRGDYSYGIYLYGAPLQQVVYSFGGPCATPVGNFIVSVVVALGVAALSWHLVEAPVLARKKIAYQLERHLVGRFPNALRSVLGVRTA